jgi:hypothetical protein
MNRALQRPPHKQDLGRDGILSAVQQDFEVIVTGPEMVQLPIGVLRIPSDLPTVHSDGFLIRTEVGLSELVVYLTREIRNQTTTDPSAITTEAVVRIYIDFGTLMRLSEGIRATAIGEFVLAAE